MIWTHVIALSEAQSNSDCEEVLGVGCSSELIVLQINCAAVVVICSASGHSRSCGGTFKGHIASSR